MHPAKEGRAPAGGGENILGDVSGGLKKRGRAGATAFFGRPPEKSAFDRNIGKALPPPDGTPGGAGFRRMPLAGSAPGTRSFSGKKVAIPGGIGETPPVRRALASS